MEEINLQSTIKTVISLAIVVLLIATLVTPVLTSASNTTTTEQISLDMNRDIFNESGTYSLGYANAHDGSKLEILKNSDGFKFIVDDAEYEVRLHGDEHLYIGIDNKVFIDLMNDTLNKFTLINDATTLDVTSIAPHSNFDYDYVVNFTKDTYTISASYVENDIVNATEQDRVNQTYQNTYEYAFIPPSKEKATYLGINTLSAPETIIQLQTTDKGLHWMIEELAFSTFGTKAYFYTDKNGENALEPNEDGIYTLNALNPMSGGDGSGYDVTYVKDTVTNGTSLGVEYIPLAGLIIVPLEVTVETSESSTMSNLVLLIPLLMLVGVILTVVTIYTTKVKQ